MCENIDCVFIVSGGSFYANTGIHTKYAAGNFLCCENKRAEEIDN